MADMDANPFVAMLAHTKQYFDRSTECLDEDDSAFCPSEGMFTVAQQVALQRERVDMRVRYQDPEIMEQDMGGLISDIDLIEDRSRMSSLGDTQVVYDVDVDIVVTFANGEQEQGVCGWPVNLELYEGLWYGLLGALIALALVLTALYLLDGPVQRLAGLYESNFALRVLDPISLLGVVIGGPGLGLAGAWLAVGRHLAQIQPE